MRIPDNTGGYWRCKCGIFADAKIKRCLNCGRNKKASRKTWSRVGIGVLKRYSKGILSSSAILGLSIYILGLINQDARSGSVLTKIGLTILLLVGASQLLIFKSAIRRGIATLKAVASRIKTVEPNNCWNWDENEVYLRIKGTESKLAEIREQQLSIRKEDYLSPEIQSKLEKTLSMAAETITRSLADDKTHLDKISFMRWQTQWIPLVAKYQSIGSLNDINDLSILSSGVRESANPLLDSHTEINSALSDLDRLDGQLERKRHEVTAGHYIDSIVKIVGEIDLIQEDRGEAPCVAPFNQQSLKEFPWYIEPSGLSVKTEELEDELRRLRTELDIENEFPTDRDRE